MTTELDERIRLGWSRSRPEAPEATVAYFADLVARHQGNALALFAYASSLDLADRDAEAAAAYERALAAGLDEGHRVRALIQYGSALRSTGRAPEAVAVLRTAVAEYPANDAAVAFLALALASAGEHTDAVATSLRLVLDRVVGEDLRYYDSALRGYVAELSAPAASAAECR